MRAFAPAVLLGAYAAVMALPADAQQPGFTDRFCVQAPHGGLCPSVPVDQTDFDSNFEYMLLVKGAQDPFDMFSWQSFVALNWPADASGSPNAGVIGGTANAPRVWQSFVTPDRVFGPDQTCPSPDNVLLIDELEQADRTVLIDQELNFVVYDTRLNTTAADYVIEQRLVTLSGQQSSSGEIAFPQGSADSGQSSSVLTKTSWRILTTPGQADGFFTRPGVIQVPADRSASGADLCLSVRLGLVGMHIVSRTESGNGDEWIWSTFEHVDNAPVAANARNVNSIFSRTLFQGGCTSPTVTGDYSFFNPDCLDCAANVSPVEPWLWAQSPPFAGPASQGSQIVRCWEIFDSTAQVNDLWQQKLAGTVWSNYMLISTQWRGAAISPLFEHGEVPRFLTNTTMESYLQDDPAGTCLGCHADAVTAAGKPSNFTFLLRKAQ